MSTSSDARVNAYDCTTDQKILAPAGDREQAIIYNDSAAADLYVRLGTSAATSSNYSVKLAKGEALILDGSEYQGEAHAIFSAADAGKVRVTEVV